MAKAFRQLERVVRGFANHRRIEAMDLLESEGELDLQEIARRSAINYKTASEHLRRLTVAGLVMKRAKGRQVLHVLSPRGRKVLTFLRTLE
jgi:predicted transcriptional regulator